MLYILWVTGQGGDAPRPYYQGQRPDFKMTSEKQGNNDPRSLPPEEDMDIGYEDKHLSQTLKVSRRDFSMTSRNYPRNKVMRRMQKMQGIGRLVFTLKILFRFGMTRERIFSSSFIFTFCFFYEPLKQSFLSQIIFREESVSGSCC